MSINRLALLFVALSALPVFGQVPGAGAGFTGGDSAGSSTNKTPPPVTGEQVYVQVCQGCHMADGKGGQGAAAIPALAKNPKLSEAAYPISMIAQGRGAMPPLTDLLNASQIAAVTTYVRTHFGNGYKKPVTEADVKMMLGQ